MDYKMITFEINKEKDAIEIHLNESGLQKLKELINNIENNGHYHLMTPSWGGDELAEQKQNKDQDVEIIHHVKMIYWQQ